MHRNSRPGTRNLAGFTLLEVMVALMLTSLIAMLGYAAAQVSFDARALLAADLQQMQSSRGARQIVSDALRNAQPPQQPEDPGFQLKAERLTFVAAGGASPLDPDYDWRISIGPAGKGIEFVAQPLGRAPPAEVRFALPDVSRWEVLVPGGQNEWVREWPDGAVLPRVVEIRTWNDSAVAGSPFRVNLVP